MTAPATNPDACPSCGPGYRYGDDGCQHSPAAPSPGTPEADDPHPDKTRIEFEHGTDLYAAWKDIESSLEAGWKVSESWCLHGQSVPHTWRWMRKQFGDSLDRATVLVPVAALVARDGEVRQLRAQLAAFQLAQYGRTVQIWMHTCGHVEGFDVDCPPDTGGCDACESGSDDLADWQPLYRKATS